MLLLTNYNGVYRRAEIIIPCKMHMVNSDNTTHWYLLLDTQTFDWPTARPATTNKHGKHTTHYISSHILSLFTKYKYTDNIYSRKFRNYSYDLAFLHVLRLLLNSPLNRKSPTLCT